MNIQSKIEGDEWLWTNYASPLIYLFQNKVMFLLKCSIIYDEPPLTTSIKPPFAGFSRVAAKWRFNCITFTNLENERKPGDKLQQVSFNIKQNP